MIQYMSLYNIRVIKLQSIRCPWRAGNCLSCVYALWGRKAGTPYCTRREIGSGRPTNRKPALL